MATRPDQTGPNYYKTVLTIPADRVLPNDDDTVDIEIQCLDIIESLSLSYMMGNVLKYIWRAGKKEKEEAIKDLKKAAHYIGLYIHSLMEE